MQSPHISHHCYLRFHPAVCPPPCPLSPPWKTIWKRSTSSCWTEVRCVAFTKPEWTLYMYPLVHCFLQHCSWLFFLSQPCYDSVTSPRNTEINLGSIHITEISDWVNWSAVYKSPKSCPLKHFQLPPSHTGGFQMNAAGRRIYADSHWNLISA